MQKSNKCNLWHDGIRCNNMKYVEIKITVFHIKSGRKGINTRNVCQDCLEFCKKELIGCDWVRNKTKELIGKIIDFKIHDFFEINK